MRTIDRVRRAPCAAVLSLLALCPLSYAAPVTVPFGQMIHAPLTTNVTLDLNNDAVNDVVVSHYNSRATGIDFAAGQENIQGLNGASILMSGSLVASRTFGQTVGPADTFGTTGANVIIVNTITTGTGYAPPAQGNPDFVTPSPTATGAKYAVGVKIPVGGQNYYAWLGVESSGNAPGTGLNTLFLDHYGYETSPNTAVAVTVPEPASLSVLVLAAAPLLARRRRVSN
jgi:hypothetical protein